MSWTNIDCGALDSDSGYFLALVYLECAWLGSVYRCGLVVVCDGECKHLITQRQGCELRTSQSIKVSIWEDLAPLCRRLALASLESLGEGGAYADVVSSCGGHPRRGSRHYGRREGGWWEEGRITSQVENTDTSHLVSLNGPLSK